MKWIYIFFTAAFTMLASGCSVESYSAIPPDKAVISTVNIKDMSLSFFDMDDKKKLPDWNVDRPYIGGIILPDQDTYLLYGKTLDSVDLYSLSKGKKIDSWDTGKGIVNALLVRDGNEIAFADQDRDSIRFYSLEGEEIDEVKTEREPLILLEAESADKLFVISFNHKKLGIIDLDSKKQAEGFEIHAAAAGAMLSEKKGELWIGGHGEGAEVEEKIHVYDVSSGQLLKEISAPMMPVNIISDRKDIFVLSHGSNMLYKLGEDGLQKDSIKIAANPFEMKLFDGKLIVAGYDSNDLYIVDPVHLEIEKTLSVGNGPFQIVTRERKIDESH